MPNLTDADKVLRNDTGKNIVSALNSIASGLTAPDADKVGYDNTASGLLATNVQSAIDEVVTDIENLPEPMVFKGTVGTGGTIASLPTDGTATVGDTYKVITEGTYAGISAKVGDTFICDSKTSSANTWTLVPSGDEPSGTVTNVATGVGLTGGPITDSGTIKAKLKSETTLTNDSVVGAESAGRVFSVVPDKSGNLAVPVPSEIDDSSDSSDKTLSSAKIKAELDDKADINGSYDNMTVGNSKQLVSTVNTEDKVPYNFRTSGGSADIGDRLTDKLVGGTVAFNQLVNTDTTEVATISRRKYFTSINGSKSIVNGSGTAISINDASEDNVIDLTQMFGSTIADYIYTLEQGTAGAGVAWFKALFPKSYYAYNAGELMSVKTSSHNTIGFNAFNPTTNTAILLGGYEYQISGTYTSVSYTDINGDSETLSIDGNGKFTPNNNGTLTVVGGNSTDTCVHLVWDGERDGEYEPYVKHEYDYSGEREVTRYFGIVDLGTLNWQYGNGVFYTSNLSAIYQEQSLIGDVPSLICEQYETVKYANVFGTDHAISSTWKSTNIHYIYIKDNAYTDAATFKTAISGVYLIYELKEPFDETVSNPELRGIPKLDANNKLYYYGDTCSDLPNPQIVDDFGTEEYVDTRAVAIPVGHDTLYQPNLRAKLEMAPDSPDGNGDYIVRHTNGTNEYVKHIGLPTPPTTNGTYTLKCTVSGSTVSYAWVADS